MSGDARHRSLRLPSAFRLTVFLRHYLFFPNLARHC
jgi:hypothetical protein